MLDLDAQQSLRLCDGVTRRRILQVGGLGAAGLSLPQLLASQSGGGVGRAKRVIMLFMWGGPAHQDTWDLKPEAPVETRGEFQPIDTVVPGLQISEHFPLIAKQADKLAIIRSVGQEDNRHSTGAHAGLTGRKHPLSQENFSASESDFPHYGSVLAKLRPGQNGMPPFVALPDVISTTSGPVVPGQFGGMLGRKYDPFQITDHPERDDFSIASLKLPEGFGRGRVDNRRSLLKQIDDVARLRERATQVAAMDDFYQQALDMVVSPATRKAFDIASVPDEERWRYGWHCFGQSVLMARRLVEAGVQLVTVYWHREKRGIDSSWDTHSHNFVELKNRLMPSVDRPIAALLEDLEQRGLLDETLVIWNSEFGRTPKINARGGRDHWGPCNSVVLAGGGIRGGQVYGSSDAQAAYPESNKVTQDNISATIYQTLGIDPHTLIHDRLDRPFPVSIGQPIEPLLAGTATPKDRAETASPVSQKAVGPFTTMLRERGGRYVTCDLGNVSSEREWKLTGWSEPAGAGVSRHRVPQEDSARLEFTGLFHSHFDYSHLAIRLAQPAGASDVRIQVGDSAVAVPESLSPSEARDYWEIPLAAGLIKGTNKLVLSITADEWQVTDVALLGDPVHPRFRERFRV